jgi:hypothetical protein
MACECATALERCMSALSQLRQWQNAAKRRRLLMAAIIGLPLIFAMFLLAKRFLSIPLTITITLASIAVLGFFAWRSVQIFDNAWLIRQLDLREGNLEDSSDLLFKPVPELSTLQNLQRERIEQRVLDLTKIDLREQWPIKIIALSFSAAFILGFTAIFFPQEKLRDTITLATPANAKSASNVPVLLINQQIVIRAPAYTGLSARSEKNLQVKFPEGSTLSWNLQFQPQPASVSLLFYDGSRVALQKNGESWQASRTFLQSSLYRVQINERALSEDKLYRLDAIKDLPPQLRVIQPDRNLSLVELGQTDWPLSFEAEDDYGLANATLRIQLAQGSGENIKFSEQSRNLVGLGSRTRKRFAEKLDLSALGIGPGDDVIIQFSVSDQRSPQNNVTRSSSFILRWPPEDSMQATGVEGMVQKAIPAYFRSQRQIIIDTEKLLADKNKLSAEKFAIQSDTIGVDQRILRLRYGQFLGEEAEGGRDESASPSAKEGKDGHDEHAGELPKKAVTSAEENLAIAAKFGHIHDIAEAATLLDPKTKKLLRAALDEMWQAELNLRQAKPKPALPYEYRALGFIKQVQQAERIYLARVGLELPPIDETRRLSGDRGSLKNPSDNLQAANVEDAALIKFWQSLNALESGSTAGNSAAPDFSALRNWIREHSSRSPDALGLLAAVDALEKQPGCHACLVEIKAQLWPLLPKPPAAPQHRILQNSNGQQYLDALQQERKP